MSLGKPGHTGGAASPSGRGPRRRVRWLPAVAGVLLIAALGAWMLDRGGLLVMRTPSMGTTAPAGSLVLTKPLGSTPLRRGMIVAFHVPVSGQLYMHRVAALLPGGRFRTRGDLNTSDDGWELTRSAIVGVPVAIIPDLGWAVVGLPWALAVLAAGALASFVLPRRWRPELRAITVGGAVGLPLYVVKPFVRVALASSGRVAASVSATARGTPLAVHGGAAWPVTSVLRPVPHVVDGGASWSSSFSAGPDFLARLVNGGVVPVRVSLQGAHTVIEPGHAGIIASHLGSKAPAVLEAHPVLPLWAWALLAAVVLAPLPAALLALRDEIAPAAARTRERRRAKGEGAETLARSAETAGERA